MCDYFGTTDSLTVHCSIVCGKRVLFFLCGLVNVGCIGEIRCYVVVGSASNISSFTGVMGFGYLAVLGLYFSLGFLACN